MTTVNKVVFFWQVRKHHSGPRWAGDGGLQQRPASVVHKVCLWRVLQARLLLRQLVLAVQKVPDVRGADILEDGILGARQPPSGSPGVSQANITGGGQSDRVIKATSSARRVSQQSKDATVVCWKMSYGQAILLLEQHWACLTHLWLYMHFAYSNCRKVTLNNWNQCKLQAAAWQCSQCSLGWLWCPYG